MSGVSYNLKRQSSETMLELSKKIMDEMTKGFFPPEVAVYNIEHVGDTEVLLLGFEKYYHRVESCAAVVIQVIHMGDTQVATVSGLGGGAGILHISWGANEDFANQAVLTLKAHGFQ